mgnify:CR=1 FL=1
MPHADAVLVGLQPYIAHVASLRSTEGQVAVTSAVKIAETLAQGALLVFTRMAELRLQEFVEHLLFE